MAQKCVNKAWEEWSLLTDEHSSRHFTAFVIDPVDPTVAGDAFLGALAVRLSEGADMKEALRFANASGALTTTRRDAQSSIPTRADVESFLRDRSD